MRLLTNEEYRKAVAHTGRSGTLYASYDQVRAALNGLPGAPGLIFINSRENKEYPDDRNQTDVCFGLMDEDTGNVALFWNYANGPACEAVRTLSEICDFSIAGDLSIIARFKKMIKEKGN